MNKKRPNPPSPRQRQPQSNKAIMIMQYKFYLNNLRMAPRKTRLIADLIKKMPVLQAETQLQFNKRRASLPILKLLKSGVASAVHNFNMSPENLYIFNIFVDEGPMLKRFRPRAFGRAGAIHKKTSHITLILEEKVPTTKKAKKRVSKASAFTKVSADKSEGKEPIVPKYEAPKPRRFGKVGAPTGASEEIKPMKKLGGFTRKIFRRKAIG